MTELDSVEQSRVPFPLGPFSSRGCGQRQQLMTRILGPPEPKIVTGPLSRRNLIIDQGGNRDREALSVEATCLSLSLCLHVTPYLFFFSSFFLFSLSQSPNRQGVTIHSNQSIAFFDTKHDRVVSHSKTRLERAASHSEQPVWTASAPRDLVPESFTNWYSRTRANPPAQQIGGK